MNTCINKVQYTKDEKIKQKEQQVYSKIAEILSGFEEKDPKTNQKNSEIKIVGLEDAIKELISLNIKP